MKKLLPLFLFCIFAQQGFSQCYTVSQITYAPDSFNVGTNIILTDDQFSASIQMPFSFCFFGQVFNQLIVGANGVISFDTSYAGGFNQWPINAAIPYAAYGQNCIFFPYQDLYWDSTYRFFNNTYGTAPNRRFVVSIYHSPMYGCITTKSFTGEVILYETTNVIEMHTQLKELCSSWNNGRAIMGIQGSLPTTPASVVPGRNFPNQWTASNDAWRFSPNCCPLGVEDNVDQSLFNIFPNPASNEVHLSYVSSTSEKFSVELTDVSGRIVYRDNLSAQSERIINPNVPSGIYFVRLITENGETLGIRKLTIE